MCNTNKHNKCSEVVQSDDIKVLSKWIKYGTSKPKQSSSVINDNFMDKLAKQQGVRRLRSLLIKVGK